VKLAYRGRPSRAEFPLNETFAKGSTNSTVGLSGHAKVIDDVAAHTAAGGAFYVCDDEVQSEVCVPLLDEGGKVLGIIDAEAAPKGFFNSNRMILVVAMALVVPALLP
jgi:L-methionine (R)-S-oxide reductase